MGRAAACEELSYRRGEFGELVFVHTVGQVRGEGVYVLCSWEGTNITAAPPPCNAVLELDRLPPE